MRAVLFGLVVGGALWSFPTSAQDDYTVLCPTIGKLAEAVMQGRQSGVVMSQMMELAAINEEPLRSVMNGLIKDAYARNQFSTEEYQRQAVIDFRNAAELYCYTAGD